MEQHECSLALLQTGDQRRAVGKRGPGALDDIGCRFGQHLPGHRDLGGRRQVGEGAALGKFGHWLRRRPGQGTAERALAAAQAHRQEIVVIAGRGQTRAGEADQRAAIVDPVDQPLPDLLGYGADIGHHDHRRLLVQHLRNAVGEVGAGRLDKVGEGLQSAPDVVERRQQRLRLVGLGLREQPDAAALGALVQHADGAGVMLAIESDRGEIVAQFEGHRHGRGGGRRAWREGQRGVGDAAALIVEGAGGDARGCRIVRGANGGEREAVDLVLGAGQARDVEAVGRGPDDAAGIARQERVEGGLVTFFR